MKKLLVLGILLSFLLAGAAPVLAGQTPTPSAPLPSDAKPAGERNLVVGLVAVLSIIVVAVAGLFIYRLIREGI